MLKKSGGLGSGGVKVVMNKELKLLLKLQKKVEAGSSPGVGWGSEWMGTTN